MFLLFIACTLSMCAGHYVIFGTWLAPPSHSPSKMLGLQWELSLSSSNPHKDLPSVQFGRLEQEGRNETLKQAPRETDRYIIETHKAHVLFSQNCLQRYLEDT